METADCMMDRSLPSGPSLWIGGYLSRREGWSSAASKGRRHETWFRRWMFLLHEGHGIVPRINTQTRGISHRWYWHFFIFQHLISVLLLILRACSALMLVTLQTQVVSSSLLKTTWGDNRGDLDVTLPVRRIGCGTVCLDLLHDKICSPRPENSLIISMTGDMKVLMLYQN